MKDLKYLFAYTVPLFTLISIESSGIWTYSAVFYAFIGIPLMDLLAGEDERNLTPDETEAKKVHWIFNAMLFLNLPIVFGLLWHAFATIQSTEFAAYELVGLTLSTGILLATNGINVAHELGHRESLLERLMSKALYMPCLYMHFYIEHNFGHHIHVATPEDGASAKYNQTVYSFWFTSVTKQYVSAWKLQLRQLKLRGHSLLSMKNDMLWYHLIQPVYLLSVGWLMGEPVFWFAFSVGVVSFLFLETINYIEHYGLRRDQTTSGRYERVRPHHSWNSNFTIGRITLYELTRHSDHHFIAAKKYQVLDSHKGCPTLPFGYPTSILMSLIPPLWFKVMNPRVPSEMKKIAGHV